MQNILNKLGIQIPTVLFPKTGTDLTKWSVVACDQYTSQPDYWADVENQVCTNFSTLHITLPEIYLEEEQVEERIEKINASMKKYLDESILIPQKSGFIFVDRKTSSAESRKGLILAVDLERYDYNKGSQSLIRATEGTVLERLPPRIKIRENAPIETPHIMLLIDDPEKTVIELLANKTDTLEKLYDFPLMMNGGHIKGYIVNDETTIYNIAKALEKLAEPEIFSSKYGVKSDNGILLFAAGDGNHSLATAKACWESIKQKLTDDEVKNHPARFALVEVVNVHDEGLVFEPIHRVVFNINPAELFNKMTKFFSKDSSNACFTTFSSKEEMCTNIEHLKNTKNLHIIPFITKQGFGILKVENPVYNLEVATLQCFLNELVMEDTNVKIDYIHGDDVVTELGCRDGNIGFYLPPMDKHELFKTVILDGTLPRKTFSMGEAAEKRYYLECRKICKD